jgi:phosphoribosylaminoimidazole-succinocarboxamide synthase
MGVDPRLLAEQCSRTLERSDFAGLGERIEGKVRDSYRRGNRRTLVVTDRVSCFDVVVGTLPFKGQVLNQIAAFWFEATADVAPNHLLSVPDPNVSIVRECRPLPVEFVMRAYLTGSTSTSIWTAYARGERRYCGHRLPDGLRKHEPLPQPILTPTTKEERHDLPLTPAQARERVGGAIFDPAEKAALALFARGTEVLAKHGILLADTKFEFGLIGSKLVLIDEALTPDSSRFWPASAWKPGTNPPSYDKQVLRDWLETLDWNKQYPPPPLSPEVIEKTAAAYFEICRKITGRAPEGARA